MSIELSGGPQRGNIIGVPNLPTIGNAPGLWQLGDHLTARLTRDWPFAIGGYWQQLAAVSPDVTRERVYQLIDSTDTVVLRFVSAVQVTSNEGKLAFSSDSTGYRLALGGLGRWSFASDIFLTLGTGYPDATWRISDMSFSSSSDGYSGGGRLSTGVLPPQSDFYKWSFSNDARSSVGSLPLVRWASGNASSSTKGYVFGGRASTSATLSNAILDLPFSTETWSTLTATISAASEMFGGAASTNSAYLAYQMFNQPERFDRFDFATEAITALTPTSPFRVFLYATPTKAVSINVTSNSTNIRFFDFSTETLTTDSVSVTGFTSGSSASGAWYSQV
jgi:hypothetical protein